MSNNNLKLTFKNIFKISDYKRMIKEAVYLKKSSNKVKGTPWQFSG